MSILDRIAALKTSLHSIQTSHGPSIIPLTVTDITQWIGLEHDDSLELEMQRFMWINHSTETQNHFQIMGAISRLEPLEVDFLNVCNRYYLLFAAYHGHSVYIRTSLSVDPSMTKMVNKDGRSALH
eukprot:PhF_6_TR27351/c6_g2_i1/m.40196